MILTENTSSSFTPCPAGSFLASLRRIIDLGTQTSTFEGKTTSARKVLLTWEIVDADTYTAAAGRGRDRLRRHGRRRPLLRRSTC
jgi:hypothetical protein